jgi:hypothetical protein
LDTNELSIGELRQILEDVARDIPMIPLSKDGDDVAHRASPVAEIQDCPARRVEKDDAFGIKKNPLLTDRIEIEPRQPPENRHRRSG